jgi:hypothetical protein
MTTWRARGGFGRTAVAALASAGAVFASLGSPLAGPAESQEAAYIDSGQAHANAKVIDVRPATGALALAIGIGQAVAETSGSLAQAKAQTFNLGLIGSTLTDEPCDGSDPPLQPEQLPQPTQLDNRSGPASAETAEAPLAGTRLGAGIERATADLVPSSRAVVLGVGIDLDPLIRIAGGEATAEAEVLRELGREARSTVTIDLSIGGIVELNGLRWFARHRTGTDAGAEAGFEIGALRLLGLPLPASAIEPAAERINNALKSLGVRIEIPRVERITDPVDLVRVTPLRIFLDESPVGSAVVRPVLEATQSFRYQLNNALVELHCRVADVLLAGDIGLGIAAGTGSLAIDLGGAEARSTAIVYEDPFGSDERPLVVLPPPLPDVLPVLPQVTVPRATQGAPAPQAAPVAAPPVAPVVYRSHCESTHPEQPWSCSRGSAGLVGGLGIIATAGVALADLRRRRRSVPAGTAS